MEKTDDGADREPLGEAVGLPVPLAVGEKPRSSPILGLSPLSQGRLT